MTDVLINGVRYVPESNKPNTHHIKRLSSVLAKECPYLSRSARDRIVKKFELSDVSVPKKPAKNTKKKNNKKLINFDGIKKIDKDGHVVFKNRNVPSEWTIYDATEIRQWVNYGKSDKGLVRKLSEKLGLKKSVIYFLMYNLEHEEFNTWLDSAVSKNVTKPKEEKPKREDVGWFE